MASADLRDEVTCSICLDVYIDPVTLRCGHNFCRVCIDRVLDAQEGSGEYSCPECRAHCQERPELLRNIALRNIAERFLSHPEHEVDGVFCTYCDFPVPAVKSCLQCETSMCDNHLRKHDRSVTHTLILPTTSLGNRKCSIHKKILEYYCTEDSACICATCRLDGDHRGHQVETLDEASEKKKEKLRNVLEKLTSKREETERRVQSLQEHRSDVKDKAADVIVWVVALFKDIRRQLDKLEKSVLSDISGQEERVSLSVSGLIRQLEIKKDELSRKMSHIEELCNMTDPVTVLQESGRGDTQEGDNRERDDIKVHDVGDLDECLISNTLNTGLSNIITGLNAFFHIQEPADVLMDVKTAGNYVDISGDLKTATRSEKRQKHPKTAERFQCNQVLSTQSFSSGRHYWEVEGSDSGWWMIGVCYPSIYKAGDQSWIGNNKKSWCLYRSNNQYSVAHNGQVIQLAHKSFCNRLRIYLDYEAGRLSFYELRDPSSLLFTFTATFTEPLHAAFSICQDICGGNGRVTIVSSNK